MDKQNPYSETQLQDMWLQYKNLKPKQHTQTFLEEELLKAHIKYVNVALNKTMRKAPTHTDRNTLYQEGLIGLYDAMQKYDPGRENKFSTYALIRIEGAIVDHLRAVDWVPRSTRETLKTIQTAREQYLETHGVKPTNKQLSEETGIVEKTIEQADIWLNQQHVKHLDQHLTTGEEGQTLADTIAQQPQPTGFLEQQIITQALNRLPEQEQNIITQYYYEAKTLKQIGETLNITESGVSHHLTDATNHLKAALLGFKENGKTYKPILDPQGPGYKKLKEQTTQKTLQQLSKKRQQQTQQKLKQLQQTQHAEKRENFSVFNVNEVDEKIDRLFQERFFSGQEPYMSPRGDILPLIEYAKGARTKQEVGERLGKSGLTVKSQLSRVVDDLKAMGLVEKPEGSFYWQTTGGVLKGIDPTLLVTNWLVSKHRYLFPENTPNVSDLNLTDIEDEVFVLYAKGHNQGEVAKQRGVSIDTVKSQLKSIREKMRVVGLSGTQEEILLVALDSGVLEPLLTSNVFDVDSLKSKKRLTVGFKTQKNSGLEVGH